MKKKRRGYEREEKERKRREHELIGRKDEVRGGRRKRSTIIKMGSVDI